MTAPPKRPLLQLAVTGILVAVLVSLAVLQYRWSLEISRAERARIEASLNTAVSQFRQEFYRELTQVCTNFHNEPANAPEGFLTSFAERYHAWNRTAPHPDLIAAVYVWQTGASPGSRMLALRQGGNQFEPAEWPQSLAALRDRLADESHRPPHPPGPELHMFGWSLEQQIPALVHPIISSFGPTWMRGNGPPQPPPILGFLIIELSRQVLEQHLLADLAQRYFSGPDGFVYNVAVLGGEQSGSIIYRSDPQLMMQALTPPDIRVPLLASTSSEYHALLHDPPAPPREHRNGRVNRGRGIAFMGMRGAVILASTASQPWQLWVRHRAGSLEAVVAADRRRNLVFSFGVLLLLAVSMAMIIISTQRARRLAQLQMEFVAGVSHELRTPLAVICSAADNLAEGFVGAKDQVKEYGALIRNEGRRLGGMVEQILYFAAGQAGRSHYQLQRVEVGEVVGSVLAGIAALPEADGFTVERNIDPDLPPVQADPAALTRCLQNLVVNAVKYGGESRWARISAERSFTGGAPAVRITVADRGAGIDPADLSHIFEPFYRGKAAIAAQIHGSGLGLSLARDIAQAMGGRLSVTSQPGHGAIFTLDLPAAVQTAEPLPQSA